jgi:micrococcal nuclease
VGILKRLAKWTLYGFGALFLLFVVLLIVVPAPEGDEEQQERLEQARQEQNEKAPEKYETPSKKEVAKEQAEQQQQQAQSKPEPKKPKPEPEPKQVAEEPQQQNGGTYQVTRVVDGDTIEVAPAIDGIEDVRLIGVDTPETYGGEEPCGPEASTFTTSRLEGRQVRLELDEDRVDPYNRILAYVYVDGAMFNEVLVQEGYASVFTFPPNDRYEQRFIAAEATAPTLTCSAPATSEASATASASASSAASASAEASAPAAESGGDKFNNGVDDVNCSDLSSPIPTPPGDEDQLDEDGDGTACDSN